MLQLVPDAKVVCIASVNFHVTNGQTIDCIYPESSLSACQLKNLPFFGLPDHNSSSSLDNSFSFKLDEYYGATFYRQEQDINVSRNYSQKSLVIVFQPETKDHLTSDFSFFEKVAKFTGPLCFDFGFDTLKAAFLDISEVLSHEDKCRLRFKMLGSDLFLPTLLGLDLSHLERQNSALNLKQSFLLRNLKSQEQIKSSKLFSFFGEMSVALWHLWEMGITGEDILILGKSPEIVSQFVKNVLDLFSPIEYANNIHPYFTIYDPKFKKLQKFFQISHPNTSKHGIFGVTNPYFLKSFKNFPNVINFNQNFEKYPALKTQARGFCFNYFENRSELKFLERDYIVLKDDPVRRHRRNSSMDSNISRRTMKRIRSQTSNEDITTFGLKDYKPITIENKSEFLSDHKYERSNFSILSHKSPLLKPDYAVLNRLFFVSSSDKTKSQNLLNDQILRQEFGKLTNSFLKPLDHFFVISQLSENNSLHFGPYNNDSVKLQFNKDKFLQYVLLHPPSSTHLRSCDYLTLYSRFLHGPNFKPWLRKKQAQQKKVFSKIFKSLRSTVDGVDSLVQLVKHELKLLQLVDSHEEKSLELDFQSISPEKELVRRMEHQLVEENDVANRTIIQEDLEQLKTLMTD